MPEMTLNAVTAGNPAFNVYLYTLTDAPGVVAQNNFVSFFNPSNSGRLVIALAGIVSAYATGTSSTSNSLTTRRITGASSGSLVAANTVERFVTSSPDPAFQVRTGNPTITGAGNPLSSFPPPISIGTGTPGTQTSPSGAPSFVCFPGQGLVFNTAAGNINQVWNVTFLWGEIGIDAVKG